MAQTELSRPAMQPLIRVGIGRRLPTDFMRMGPATVLAQILQEFGFSPERVLSDLGIAADLFSHPDNALPYSDFCRLLSHCAELTGRDDLGLLVGARCGASSLGLAGFLSKQEPTVRSALMTLVRHLHQSDKGGMAFLEQHGEVAVFGYSNLFKGGEASEQITDGALAIIANILRQLCADQWRPLEIALSRPVPKHPADYVVFFGGPVRFNAERSEIAFPSSLLDRRSTVADPALRRVLQEQLDLLEIDGLELSDQVRRVVRAHLPNGRISVDQVAAELGVTRRTLSRQLNAIDLTFHVLVEEVQLERARHLLKNKKMTITEIGLALGFSEASAFSRAFQKWSGSSPRAWRAKPL